MPYKVFRNQNLYCVYKVNDQGERTGKTLGCHNTEKQAKKQIAAIMASENEDEKKQYE